MFFKSLGGFASYDFHLVYDSFGGDTPAKRKKLAELFDVTEATAKLYTSKKKKIPKAYARLLWWESNWGREAWAERADQYVKLLGPQVQNLTDLLNKASARCVELELEIAALKAGRTAPDRFVAANDSSATPPLEPLLFQALP